MDNDKVIPSQTLGLFIDIKNLSRMSRMEMLELRDEMTELLAERFGCRELMSVDGTTVYMDRVKPGDEPANPLEALAEALRRDG